MDISRTPFTTTAETLKHPAFPSAIWALEPERKGNAIVATECGGPINIAWEIHGHGPTKLIFIMGLGAVKTVWQQQTCYFGHDRGDKYSVLILDNRGIGESDKPLRRYTTSEMALDIIEVVDHVGWTDMRQLNIVGISLGGMIAQEIGCLIPARLQSLSLLCTTSDFQSNKSLFESLRIAVDLVMPKSRDVSIRDMANKLFADEWLSGPDTAVLPSCKRTPKCGPAPGTKDGEYLRFGSNFERFQAQELVKRAVPGHFTPGGFLCQLTAAVGHRKSALQLHDMADKIGRERILILHGADDNLIHPMNGEKLIRLINPGVGLIIEGCGHVPIAEKADWFNGYLEEHLRGWQCN